MNKHESLVDPYAFNPEEVTDGDSNVLEFHIPFSAESKLRLGGLALANEVEMSVDE